MPSSCSACLSPSAAADAPSSAPAAPPAPASTAAGARWSAVASLGMGVFGLVTAEFLPASLLTAIAADLGVSTGTAGQAVTATALVGAVAAPAIPVLTRRLDRKWVLLALTVLLVLSNVLSATAGSFAALLAARVMLGVALGGFWSMAAALAMRLVPGHLFARAMAVILTGVSVATVCAAPMGAWMGDLWGWRSAFMAASVVSLLTLAAQVTTLPRLPARDFAGLRALGLLLTRPHVRFALLAVLLVISGHFAGFTYIRPLMEDVTGLSVQAISAVLLAYGIGGFFGNFAGGWIAERSERHAVIFGSTLIVALAVALLVAGRSASVTAVAVTLWGFAFGAFPVGFQTWITRAAPDHAEAAGGLLVAAFQVAIATGAIGGGLLVDHMGALGGPAFAVAGLSLGCLVTLRHGPRRARA